MTKTLFERMAEVARGNALEHDEASERRAQVLAEVEAYLARTGTTASTLGFVAVRNTTFVRSLRQDLRRLDGLRASKVRAAMVAHPDGMTEDTPPLPARPHHPEVRPIEDRLDEAYQRLLSRRLVPKVFYLSPADLAEAGTYLWARGLVPIKPSRAAKPHSMLYATCGKSVSVATR